GIARYTSNFTTKTKKQKLKSKFGDEFVMPRLGTPIRSHGLLSTLLDEERLKQKAAMLADTAIDLVDWKKCSKAFHNRLRKLAERYGHDLDITADWKDVPASLPIMRIKFILRNDMDDVFLKIQSKTTPEMYNSLMD